MSRIRGKSTDVDITLSSRDRLIIVTEPATVTLADDPRIGAVVQVVTDSLAFPGARVSVHGGRFPIEGGHIHLHQNSIVTIQFTSDNLWVSKGPRARTHHRGEEGPRGHEGDRGRRGHHGPTGPTGPSQGPTGPAGSTGPTGATGSTGATGGTAPSLLNRFARLEIPTDFISGDPPATVTSIALAPNSLTTGILEIVATASVHSVLSSLGIFTINVDGTDLAGFTVQPETRGDDNGFDSGSVIFKVPIINLTIAHNVNLNFVVPINESTITIGPVGAPTFGDNASLFIQELPN
jgi:hypothetical protein